MEITYAVRLGLLDFRKFSGPVKGGHRVGLRSTKAARRDRKKHKIKERKTVQTFKHGGKSPRVRDTMGGEVRCRAGAAVQCWMKHCE